MRTHYCGQINASLFDEDVELYGWVHRRRDHGGLIFIDLRDREGIVQLVVNPENQHIFSLAEKLHNEDVIKIKGKVKPRPKDMVNKEIATGGTEIDCHFIEILSRAKMLPFQVNEYREASDEIRLKYRYLDLRRPIMAKNIMFRSQAAQVLRHYLDKHGFVEVETPLLTKTTPEGARDYLVPSRNNPGCFYALPQSPQIFKQLLMIGGIDRYYQIVRCFRDEDLRADRQPEFTQLDIEMSFIDEKQLQDLMEGMLREVFAKLLNVALPNPFTRLTYGEALLRFGTEAPDLRIPLELVDIDDLVKDAEFKVFTDTANDPGSRIAALRLPKGCELSRKAIDDYTKFVNTYGAKGLIYIKVYDLNASLDGLQSPILKFIAKEKIDAILARVAAENDDMIFFCADKQDIVNPAMAALRIKLGRDFNLVEDGWRPLWIVDFPMFEKAETGWTFKHHPFTAPIAEDTEDVKSNPGKLLSRAYDVVLNGTEIGGGSIRINNIEIQKAVFSVLGIDAETAQAQFGHLLTALKYGCPPHGGIAFGFDRLIMLLAKAKSLREVIAFPKTQTASCPLTRAPSPASEKQLNELGLKLKGGNCGRT